MPDRHPPNYSRTRRSLIVSAWTMLAPAIILFACFIAAPIAYTLYLSFQKVQVEGLGLGADSRKRVFAGFENYAVALSNPEFGASVLRVLIYGAILVPSMLTLALLFALLLDSRRARARRFARISIFLPFAVPAVIASLMWGFLYLPAVSPIAYVLERAGLNVIDPLSNDWILLAIANIALWGGTGFNMIVLYTSLRAIPSDLYEAARIDGCNEVQIALRIKIPIIIPALVMTGLFSMIATLQVFAEPWVLKPLTNNLPSTFTPLMMIYRDAFIRSDISAAAALSVIIATATFVGSYFFLRIVQRRAFAEEARS